MAVTSNYRLPDDRLDNDRAALVAIRDLEDYRALNPQQSVESLVALERAHRESKEAVQRGETQLAAQRNAEIEAGWAFHNAIMGAKANIAAQYGNDAQVIESIGLTRRSKRKRPVRTARRPKE